MPPDLKTLRRLSVLMDGAVRVPGTNFRFGLDAVVGLIPGVGDVVGAVVTYGTMVAALRHRVPGPVLVQMVLNALLDAGLGSVPVLGDVFDALWRHNMRNLDLLLLHRDASQPPRPVPVLARMAAGAVALVLLAGSAGIVVLVYWLLQMAFGG